MIRKLQRQVVKLEEQVQELEQKNEEVGQASELQERSWHRKKLSNTKTIGSLEAIKLLYTAI